MPNFARRFAEIGTDHVSIPHDVSLAFPAASWFVGFPFRFHTGQAAGTSAQYLLSWGGYGAWGGVGSLNVVVYETEHATNPGQLEVNFVDVADSRAQIFGNVASKITDAAWHYFLLRYDHPTGLAAYVDGVSLGSSPGPFQGIDRADAMVLGGRSTDLLDGRAFGGDLAEFIKVHRAPTAAEESGLAAFTTRAAAISGLVLGYELGAASPEAPLVAGTPGATVSGTTSVAGPFAPQNTAPAVTVTHPSAAALSVPAGTKLVFTATATDVESGSLTGSIVWSSSNPADGTGGALGTAGGSVTVDTTGWANGQRTITANVTDAGGLPATPDSFTLTIGPAGSTLILEDDVQQEILQGGVAATVRVALRDSTGAVLESNPLAPGDVKKSVDGGAAAVLAGDAGAAAWTVVNGFLNVPLTAAEVTGSEITLFIEDQDGSAYLDRAVKVMVVGYDPRATPASTTQIAGAVGDALSARLAS